MKDGAFKGLKHSANGYNKFSDGKLIEKNYSPDFVLNKDDDYILIEHESQPNRKTIIGDLVKAAHFLVEKKTGILVIVITPKGESSLVSYSKHIRQYFNWLADKTNLRRVYFIHESEYEKNGECLPINSKEFDEKALKVEIIE